MPLKKTKADKVEPVVAPTVEPEVAPEATPAVQPLPQIPLSALDEPAGDPNAAHIELDDQGLPVGVNPNLANGLADELASKKGSTEIPTERPGSQSQLDATLEGNKEFNKTANAADDLSKTSLLGRGVNAVAGGLRDSIENTLNAGGMTSGTSEVPKGDSIAESVTRGVSQFFGDFIGAGKLLKAGKILQGTGKVVSYGRAAIQGAASDALAFDPLEARMSNLIQDSPSLANPITEYLASDADDSQLEGRLKNAIEGCVLGLAADGLLAAVKGTKRVIAARLKGGDKAAAKVEAEVAEEIETITSHGKVGKVTPLPGTAGAAPELMSPELKAQIVDNLGKPPTGTIVGQDFNVSKFLDAPDGGLHAIDEVSTALAPEIDKLKGGIQTLKETEELADILGTKAPELATALARDAKDASSAAARLVAGKRLLISTAGQVSQMAEAVRNGLGDSVKLSKMMDFMGSLQMNLKAVQTGAARTTSAGRITITPDLLTDLVMAGGDARKVARILDPQTLLQRGTAAFTTIRVNNMLANPITQATNIVGGAVKTFLMPAERIIGGALSLNKGAIKDGLRTYTALISNAKDSLRMAGKALKLESPVLAAKDSVLDGVPATRSLGNSWLAQAVRLPTRLMMTADEFFKQVNYRSAIQVDAMEEGLSKGLKGDALTKHVTDSINDSLDTFGTAKLTGERQRSALERAKRATYTQDLENAAIAGFDKWARSFAPLNVLVPFRKAPWNILKDATHHVPGLGAATSKEFRADWVAGGSRRAEVIGKMAVGTAFATAVTSFVASGTVSGKRPKGAVMPDGWQPYSFKMGDTWVSYQKVEPFGTVLGTIADYCQIANHATEQDRDNMVGSVMVAMAANLSNKTYLQGLGDIVELAESGEPDKWEAFARKFAATSALPAYLGQAAKEADPHTHQAWDLKEEVMRRIPGFSDELPPMRNILGAPVDHSSGTFMVSPFALSKDTPEPVMRELSRLSQREGGFAMPDRVMGKVELSHQQYDRLLELSGTMKLHGHTLMEALNDAVGSAKYKDLGDSRGTYGSAKRDWLNLLVGKYRLAAGAKLREEDKVLKAAWIQDKINKGAVKADRTDIFKSLAGLNTNNEQ